MKKTAMLLLLFFMSQSDVLFCQANFASKKEWLEFLKTQKKDSAYSLNLYAFGNFMEGESLDSAKSIYVEAKRLSDDQHFNTGIVKYYFNYSFILNAEGKYQQGLEINKQGLKVSEALKNEEFIAKSLFNIGSSYSQLGEHLKAIGIYQNVSKYFEEHHNLPVLATVYNNLGSAYNNIAQTVNDSISLKHAVYYYSKAIEMSEKAEDDQQLCLALLNSGSAELSLKRFKEAYTHFTQGLKIAKESGNVRNEYKALIHLQRFYWCRYDYKQSIDYGQSALVVLKQLDDPNALLDCYKYLAEAYVEIKEPAKANTYIEDALRLVETMESSLDRLYIYKTYAAIKSHLKDYRSAYLYLEKYDSIKDSISGKDIVKNTNELMEKYQSEKKELQIKNQSLKIDVQEKQNQQKSLIIILGALTLLGSGCFGVMAFRNFRKTKKAHQIIELQNREVIHQKELVEVKQKEIIDSINYAQRIQQAVLTGDEVWRKISKEYFILFMPKDIVSGDFYWAYQSADLSVFALADCTGHGVPGGFMSMLGNSFLNEIVVENKLFEANAILDKLRAKIISALEQKGQNDQKDGMDIALCVWNKANNTLEFSGANNPLWIIRNGEFMEYKADKMPIGTYLEKEIPFKTTLVQLQQNDMIYLSTDGFADQFGGPKGKKLKYKALIEILMAISQETSDRQKKSLVEALLHWKMNYEQVDDISIIGIRV